MAEADYLSFGQYLALFMERRGFSGVAMARRLGEKSATVISRIKADQCTPARCEAFLGQLNACLGDLTKDELEQFRRGLLVLRIGKEDYRAYRAIHQLFTNTPALEPAHGNLHAMLQPPADADAYDVLCMQCSDPVVTDELTALCRSYTGRLSIQHYVTFPLQSTTAQIVVSLLPILSDDRYLLTELRFPDGNPGLGVTAQRFIFTRCMRGGHAEYQFLIPCSDGSALAISITDATAYERCLQFVEALDCVRIPLNRRLLMDTPERILNVLGRLVGREQNHASCLFKRDFCFSLIPLDVMQSAFNDMLLHLPDSYRQAATELRRLCYLRHQAVCNATKPVRILLSDSGVRRFLRTGKLGDHFFGLRPFTVDERKRVMTHVIELAGSNQNITLQMAHDESLFQTHDFFIFEKSCVVITAARDGRQPLTGADAVGYKEISLTDPHFVEQMTLYFQQYLLPEKFFTPEETIDRLRCLLNSMP